MLLSAAKFHAGTNWPLKFAIFHSTSLSAITKVINASLPAKKKKKQQQEYNVDSKLNAKKSIEKLVQLIERAVQNQYRELIKIHSCLNKKVIYSLFFAWNLFYSWLLRDIFMDNI